MSTRNIYQQTRLTAKSNELAWVTMEPFVTDVELSFIGQTGGVTGLFLIRADVVTPDGEERPWVLGESTPRGCLIQMCFANPTGEDIEALVEVRGIDLEWVPPLLTIEDWTKRLLSDARSMAVEIRRNGEAYLPDETDAAQWAKGRCIVALQEVVKTLTEEVSAQEKAGGI